MFAIDDRTIDYLRITGRSPEQVKLDLKLMQKQMVYGQILSEATYARTIKFDLTTVTRTLGPSQPINFFLYQLLMIEELLKIEISNDVMPDGCRF